ncbi:MAG: hypothetical protein BWY20_02282 [Spirochaetes bacterium ADurb.Bin215]|nr:MAG: hypothetical protein BWY20_02282 [Spirochaetes bacterium ADurb.Bin215]
MISVVESMRDSSMALGLISSVMSNRVRMYPKVQAAARITRKSACCQRIPLSELSILTVSRIGRSDRMRRSSIRSVASTLTVFNSRSECPVMARQDAKPLSRATASLAKRMRRSRSNTSTVPGIETSSASRIFFCAYSSVTLLRKNALDVSVDSAQIGFARTEIHS